jgi:hypothetical protein
MQRFARQIAYYLEVFRRGDADNSFHGLLEIDRDILPELIQVSRTEQETSVREFLVEVICEYREPSMMPFLREALSDTEPRIWRQALNGLVAQASPAALEILRAARARHFLTQRETIEFREWLEEAIEQAEAEAQKA